MTPQAGPAGGALKAFKKDRPVRARRRTARSASHGAARSGGYKPAPDARRRIALHDAEPGDGGEEPGQQGTARRPAGRWPTSSEAKLGLRRQDAQRRIPSRLPRRPPSRIHGEDRHAQREGVRLTGLVFDAATTRRWRRTGSSPRASRAASHGRALYQWLLPWPVRGRPRPREMGVANSGEDSALRGSRSREDRTRHLAAGRAGELDLPLVSMAAASSRDGILAVNGELAARDVDPPQPGFSSVRGLFASPAKEAGGKDARPDESRRAAALAVRRATSRSFPRFVVGGRLLLVAGRVARSCPGRSNLEEVDANPLPSSRCTRCGGRRCRAHPLRHRA